MRVRIIKPFTVDGARGRTRYTAGQIVAQGQKNWVDKKLAVEEKAEPAPAASNSAD